MSDHPRVGVGVIVMKDSKVLMGKRKGAHGEGTWSFTGGHLEFGETLEGCAQRETLEEAGITISNIHVGPYTNDIHEDEGKHYITLFVLADYAAGEVKLMEPDKFEEWRWFTWNELPQPLFLPIVHLLEQGFNPFTNKANT